MKNLLTIKSFLNPDCLQEFESARKSKETSQGFCVA
jgi:hypothetical protein